LSTAGGGGDYSFSDIGVTNEQDGIARVSYTVSWVGEFPGTRLCTTSAFDAEGNLVGVNEGIMISMQSGVTASLPVAVSTDAATAQMECAAERLDTGPLTYDIREVRVTSASTKGIVVGFRASWAGGGTPGAVTCGLRIEAVPSGEVLFDGTINVVVLDSSGAQLAHTVDQPTTLPLSALSAKIVGCDPLQ
jgi:hypothetical protein